jgi:hypothetical protein
MCVTHIIFVIPCYNMGNPSAHNGTTKKYNKKKSSIHIICQSFKLNPVLCTNVCCWFTRKQIHWNKRKQYLSPVEEDFFTQKREIKGWKQFEKYTHLLDPSKSMTFCCESVFKPRKPFHRNFDNFMRMK